MSVGVPETAEPGWAEFGRQLRCHRRRAGLTQVQLGRRVGYHHTFISRLEGGLREPPFGLVCRLDVVLETGGRLAAALAAPRHVPPAPGRNLTAPTLFSPLPGADAPGDEAPPVFSWAMAMSRCSVEMYSSFRRPASASAMSNSRFRRGVT